MGGGRCPTLVDNDCAAKRIRILRTEDCEMHVQRVYVSRDTGTGRKTLDGSVAVRDERK